MAVVGELLVLIGANGAPLTAGLTKAEGELKGFGASGTSALAGVRMAALGVGVAAVAGMGVAVGAASSFQEQMAIINTIAHQTGPELAKTGDGIRAMAVASGTPLADLTKAYYDLLSAGIKPGTQALSMLSQANTLAIGGLATTAQTVDLLTTAVNAYGLNATGAAVATDQFALAVQDGKVTADEIAATFADVAPLARTAGVGIDEISASYAVLTASGVKAPEAMTQMNRAMVELIKPGKALSALQDKMGVNFAEIAKDKGLVVALQRMRDGAEANHIPFANLFGRLEGMKFALATTGPHFKDYTAELDKMHHANGTAAAQAAERAQTFTRQIAILGASFNDLAISVGTGLLPPLTDFVKHISVAVQGVKDWAAANPGLVSAILPVVAGIAAVVVVATSLDAILGIIGTAIAVITSPIVLVGAAIAGLAAHFGLLGDGAKDAFDGIASTVLGTLSQMAGQVIGWISAQAPAWAAQLGKWADAFVGWISPIAGTALAMLGQLPGQLLAWVSAQVPGWVAQLGKWAGAFVAWIGPMITRLLGALGQVGSALVAWIAAEAPKVIGSLAQFALAFVRWVLPMIPPLLAALGQLAVAMVGWIAQQIPVLGGALLGMAAAFVGWIGPMIPQALGQLSNWLLQVLQWMGTVPGQLATAAGKFGASIFGGIMDGLKGLPAAVAGELSKIPGIGLLGDIGHNIAGAVGGAVGAPQYASGGMVPGTGPQLAIVHGGEQILNQGQQGRGQSLTHTTIVQLDEQTVGQVIERLLFNSASGSSSGFAGSSVTD